MLNYTHNLDNLSSSKVSGVGGSWRLLKATGKAGGYWRLQVGNDWKYRLETTGWRQVATEVYRKGWRLLEATGWKRVEIQVGNNRLEATGWRRQARRPQAGGDRLRGFTSNTLDAQRGRRI